MNTWNFLTGESAALFWPPIIAGLAVAAMCAFLSVLVVLKRLSFIGQGISHAAFGGIGVAAMLGLLSGTGAGLGLSLGQFGVVLTFCLAAAILIGQLSRKSTTHADTAIGIILVASMALGAVLLNIAYSKRIVSGVSWESVLFGNLLAVSWADAWIAIAVAVFVLGTLLWFRRPLTLWAFDAKIAASLGINTRFMQLLLLTLLAITTVTAMKLAGVVLATAMLVLPGAAALVISSRSRPVLVASFAFAILGFVGGLILSFETDWPPGPSIVLSQCAIYAAARMISRPGT